MNWEKGLFLYEGKAKSIYELKNQKHLVWMDFKDTLTAFNGKKKSSFKGKGQLNRDTSALVFRYLSQKGVKNHYKGSADKVSMICLALTLLPLEVVVRNRLAGSTARKFQAKQGQNLPQPLVELYYKNDALGDPFISSEQALTFGYISSWQDIEFLKKSALKVNQHLKVFFNAVGLELIDFKLEFGRPKNLTPTTKKGDFLLGDEISCDSCRLWDKTTGDKMDKDRFREDLGGVEQAYRTVYNRLYQKWGKI